MANVEQIDLRPKVGTGMLRRQGQYVNERGGSLARRRYQKGQLLLVGGTWYGRWREDRIENGKIKRSRPQEALGTLDDYPTKRLAQRALDDHLRAINNVSYRPRPTATFVQFTSRWEGKTLNQFAASTGVNYHSHIRKHLVPFFGSYAMKDIGPELVQEFISNLKVSPKTARNIAITLQSMWSSARAWGYVAHNLMEGVRFPSPKRARRFFFSAEEVQRIIVAATEPHRTFYGLAAETGLRAGELCGLTIHDLDFEKGLLQVRQSVWRGKIKDTKTIASARVVELSPQACQHLQQFLKTWRPNMTGLLFATKNGTPWDPNLVLKRKFKPLLLELNIAVPRGNGFHAFRHANATMMDRLGTPIRVRQERLGHSDPRMTQGIYTHVVSADSRMVADQLGDVVWGVLDADGRKKEKLESVANTNPSFIN